MMLRRTLVLVLPAVLIGGAAAPSVAFAGGWRAPLVDVRTTCDETGRCYEIGDPRDGFDRASPPPPPDEERYGDRRRFDRDDDVPPLPRDYDRRPPPDDYDRAPPPRDYDEDR